MKHAILFCALALCLLWASDSGAGDWPMWGGSGDRNMASAMNGATETIRIFGLASTAAVGAIVSVVITVSSLDAAMRSTAGPESTPCVVQASTRLAPASMMAVSPK